MQLLNSSPLSSGGKQQSSQLLTVVVGTNRQNITTITLNAIASSVRIYRNIS